MHRAHKLLKVLAICISRTKSQKNEESGIMETGLYIALFAVAERLMLVRHHQTYTTLSALNTPLLGSHWGIPPVHAVTLKLETLRINESIPPKHIKESVVEDDINPVTDITSMVEAKPTGVPASKIRNLPHEILELIFIMCSQPELVNISKSSKTFSAVSLRLLYRNPQIQSIKALNRFAATLIESKKNPESDLSNLVHEITFLPNQEGSLHGNGLPTSSYPINQVHSSLFRSLVYDRNIDVSSGHPLLLVLLSICPMLNAINETDHPSRVDQNSWVMSDYNLSQFLLAANRVRHMNRVFIGEENIQSIGQGISSIASDTSRLYETCMFIFEMVGTSEFGHNAGFWDDVSGSESKVAVIQAVKGRTATVMNSISGMLLHQVQYLTVSSQRLLDHYCLRISRFLIL
jgi:hypothetical protein